MIRAWRTLALVDLIGAPVLSAQPAAPADLIVHNAVIYTIDAAQPTAEALAVRGDRIVLVGANAAVLALRGPATRVVNAQGRAGVPVWHDAHGPFTGLGASLQQIDLRGTT